MLIHNNIENTWDVPTEEYLKFDIQKAEFDPRFEVVWTSFGLGDSDSFDPSLGGKLRELTTSYHYNHKRKELQLEVKIDEERHDLKLINRLMKSTSPAEVIVYLNDTKSACRLVFTVTEVKDFELHDNLGNAVFSDFGIVVDRNTIVTLTAHCVTRLGSQF